MLCIKNKPYQYYKSKEKSVALNVDLTQSLIHHFETVLNSKKLQTTTEMWLLKDFKIQIA